MGVPLRTPGTPARVAQPGTVAGSSWVAHQISSFCKRITNYNKLDILGQTCMSNQVYDTQLAGLTVDLFVLTLPVSGVKAANFLHSTVAFLKIQKTSLCL